MVPFGAEKYTCRMGAFSTFVLWCDLLVLLLLDYGKQRREQTAMQVIEVILEAVPGGYVSKHIWNGKMKVSSIRQASSLEDAMGRLECKLAEQGFQPRFV